MIAGTELYGKSQLKKKNFFFFFRQGLKPTGDFKPPLELRMTLN